LSDRILNRFPEIVGLYLQQVPHPEQPARGAAALPPKGKLPKEKKPSGKKKVPLPKKKPEVPQPEEPAGGVASLPQKEREPSKRKQLPNKKSLLKETNSNLKKNGMQEEEDNRKPPAKSMVKKKSLAERNIQKENDNTLENNHSNQEEEQVEAPKQPTYTALAKTKTKNNQKNRH
jgi:hypothetical protein